ncbi:MAG: recombinase family protein [Planctomycetes bacterium]|nr:recombinase family protein [Planctomycetota bacterium]
MSDKIRSEHLDRAAYVYVRQSSLHQVRHHLEGQRRQYALAERARALGFAKTVVIDEDLGRSGSGRQERPGFGKLLTAVCEGAAGAVFALEASRLARNNRDWHHLIDLCALTAAVIIDEDGVYDPRQMNDRLLLGLKGTMSEFELGLLRQRARAAYEQKVRSGHALWELPVGFVRTEDHRVEKIADRQVQEAIAGVFKKFRELGSARQAMLWYRDEQIPLPEVQAGTAGHEIVWRVPTAPRIRQMLSNPCYAGALVYGRRATRMVMENGRARQGARRMKAHGEWKVLIVDSHAGYIKWDEYLRNQEILEANVIMQKDQTGGAAKRGTALLSGLLRCARCGRKLFVSYAGNGGRVPRYSCHGGRVDRGHSSCQSIGALRVDRVVAEQVIQAVQPAGVEAALAALREKQQHHGEKQHSLELALEKARYESSRARKQYNTVDPENRLVAGELEKRWNEAMTRVAEIEERLAAERRNDLPVDDNMKNRLMELGVDLAGLWNHPSTPMESKKRVVRTVLEEIVIDSTEQPPEHILQLHWQGGVHTRLLLKRNTSGKHGRCTDDKLVELITELSKISTDQTIAATLNRLGYRTGGGKSWRIHSVAHIRHYYRLPNFEKGKDWLSAEQAAQALGVSGTVVKRLIRTGLLPARQVVPLAPRIIERKDLEKPAVQQAARAVHAGRRLPTNSDEQQELPMK